MSDVGSTPLLEAPTLACLYRRISERPYWAAEDPLAVDRQTFEDGLREMADIQRGRGFPIGVADIDKLNFLLHGIPVVMLDG